MRTKRITIVLINICSAVKNKQISEHMPVILSYSGAIDMFLFYSDEDVLTLEDFNYFSKHHRHTFLITIVEEEEEKEEEDKKEQEEEEDD